jgi:hypothetical protein
MIILAGSGPLKKEMMLIMVYTLHLMICERAVLMPVLVFMKRAG